LSDEGAAGGQLCAVVREGATAVLVECDFGKVAEVSFPQEHMVEAPVLVSDSTCKSGSHCRAYFGRSLPNVQPW
jgi:hypothetical protein